MIKKQPRAIAKEGLFMFVDARSRDSKIATCPNW
jgi:hypothetical protein